MEIDLSELKTLSDKTILYFTIIVLLAGIGIGGSVTVFEVEPEFTVGVQVTTKLSFTLSTLSFAVAFEVPYIARIS